jgi:hypothetical protein
MCFSAAADAFDHRGMVASIENTAHPACCRRHSGRHVGDVTRRTAALLPAMEVGKLRSSRTW